MANDIHTFDEDSVRLIAHEVQRMRNQFFNLTSELDSLRAASSVGPIQFVGKTTTNAAHPTYPTVGCKFLVQRVDHDWDNGTVNECDAGNKTEIGQYVVARTIGGLFLPENTKVLVQHVRGSHGGRWMIITASGVAQEIGKLLANLQPTPQGGTVITGTLRLWEQNGTTGPSERPGPVDIIVMQDTSTIMRTGVLLKAVIRQEYDHKAVSPAEIEECFNPKFAQGTLGGDLFVENALPFNPATDAVLEFPDTTALGNGQELWVYNVTTSSTTMSFDANAATGTDKIEDPTTPGTFKSALSGLALPNKRIHYRLDKDEYANKTWVCLGMWP